MPTQKLQDSIRGYLKKNVTRKRYCHIMRVYTLSEIIYRYQAKLAAEDDRSTSDEFFVNQSVSKLHMASLIHDATKEKSKEFHLEFLQELIEKDGEIHVDDKLVTTIDPKILAADLNQSGPVLHSKTAAPFIAQNYGYFDREVYDLVRFHTTGSDNPTHLMEIFFAADYLGSIHLFKKLTTAYTKRIKKRITQDSVFSLILDKQIGNVQSFLKTQKPIPLEILKRYHQYLPKNIPSE